MNNLLNSSGNIPGALNKSSICKLRRTNRRQSMQTNDAGRKERAYQSIPYMLTMEEVAGRNNLLAALRKVRQNAGRSGNPDRQR